MTFWANYVIAKEKKGVSREITLDILEAKYGLEFRQAIEAELESI